MSNSPYTAHIIDPAADTVSWHQRGACVDHPNEEIFHPTNEQKNDLAAKSVCARCPVSAQCLKAALAMPQNVTGIWGGTTTKERRAMRAGLTSAPAR